MRILIVEDEHRIANAIKKGLEQEGYAADVAYTGVEGYALAVTEDYDLIILDLMLPEKDGIAFCKELRGENIHIPVLILTAKGQIQDKVVGLNSGADDYLTKPFAFEELLARIRALIRRPKITQNNILAIDDLRLNTLSFEVIRNNVSISLSNKEFSFLEYFMRNTGKVLTKNQIIAHVWDYDADILPNTIEVYIRKLRNKIDLPFPQSKHLIQTVRGFGYKMGE